MTLEDKFEGYYKYNVKLEEILYEFFNSKEELLNYMNKNNYKQIRQIQSKLDINDQLLRDVLFNKYNGIVSRCHGIKDDYKAYKGLDYINIFEWVEFCNEHKEVLIKLWNEYNLNKRNLKYAISIDRIDNSIGYLKSNMQFVTHGFNSWKSSLNPIKVEYDLETFYFMSCHEADRYFGIRERTMGEILNNKPYHKKGYCIERCCIEDVLKNRNCSSIEVYYDTNIK